MSSSSYRSGGWLPVVVPHDARRFRVHAPDLAAALLDAGADLVDADVDVEIGPLELLHDDAPLVVVPLESAVREGGSRPARAVDRVRRSSALRSSVRRTKSALQRRGYRFVDVVSWELGRAARHEGVRPRKTGVADRFPLGALVVGSRVKTASTTLAAAMDDADPGADWSAGATVGAGVLVVPSTTGVLRVAIGQGRLEIRAQQDALKMLNAADPGLAVASRIPWTLRSGRHGLADWSLEQRLEGAPSPQALDGPLQRDCLEFLCELFRSGPAIASQHHFAERADVVAHACGDRDSLSLRSLARRLDDELSSVPCGFGHGDFWGGNLLVRSGRLTGVVDWDAAGPGRLPLLDLVHLRVSHIALTTRCALGHVLLEQLSRPLDDELTRTYCERIGLETDHGLLELLQLAYWLDYVSYQLRSFVDPRRQPRWFRENVETVSSVLASRWLTRRHAFEGRSNFFPHNEIPRAVDSVRTDD